ncbi:MAG: hypothetical protein ACE5IG_05600 [Dehalococcoidia bacterium]
MTQQGPELSRADLETLARTAGIQTQGLNLDSIHAFVQQFRQGSQRLSELELGDEEPAFAVHLEGGEA